MDTHLLTSGSRSRPDRRPRILLAVNSANAGGAERMALAEAEYLKQANDLVISIPDGPLRPLFAAHGELTEGTASMPLWGASAWCWAGRFARTFRQGLRLARLIRRCNVDVVLTNSSVLLAPVLAGRLAGVPAIAHARDVPGSKLAPLVFKLHRALAHTVIVISEGLEPYFRGSRGARVVRITDGVDLRGRGEREMLADPEPELGRALRLCLIGGLHPRKGQDIAVEALHSLKHAGLDVTLDLVGRDIDESFTAHLHDLVDQFDICDRVRFVGELDDVPQHLQSVDIVVAPSRGEWTPLAIMEAMAEQKPVVAADVGSVSDVIDDGVTGILVPPQDPDRLALAVIELAGDPERMSGMASRGRISIKSFDIGATLEALGDEIHHVLISSGAVPYRSRGVVRARWAGRSARARGSEQSASAEHGLQAAAASAEPESAFSPEQVREATLHGVHLFSATRAAAELTSVAAAVVLARLVAPSEFGRLAVAIIVSEFAMMVSNETIASPLVQRPEIEREHLEAATFLGLVIGFGLTLVTLFAVPLLTTPVFGARTTELFRLFAPAFAISGVFIVPLARLQRRLRFLRIGVVEVVGVFVTSVVSIALAVAGLGAKAYVLGVIAGLLAATVGYLGGVPMVRPRWHPRHGRELLGFGLPASAAGFARVAFRNIDYMILGARLSVTTVGYYYRAFTVGVEYETRLSGIGSRVAFPVFARTADPAQRLAMRLRIARVNAAIVYPLLMLFIALAPTLVPWLFGARWAPAVLPAQILAVAGMASCVRSLTVPSVLAAGRPRALFLFCLGEMLLYGGTVWIVSSYGLIAVCIAVSCFQIGSVLVAYTVLLHSTVGVSRTQIFRDVGPALLASIPVLIVGIALRQALATAIPVPALVVLAAIASGAIYATALRLLSPAAWSDVALLVRPMLPHLPRAVARRLGLSSATA